MDEKFKHPKELNLFENTTETLNDIETEAICLSESLELSQSTVDSEKILKISKSMAAKTSLQYHRVSRFHTHHHKNLDEQLHRLHLYLLQQLKIEVQT